MQHPYSSKAWRRFRLLILQRDGWRCVKCKVSVAGKGHARVDHITPLSQGGALLDPANCRTLCASCDNAGHAEKGGAPGRARTGKRVERFVIRGADATGAPRDPGHHWNR